MKLYKITEQLRELMAMDDVPAEQLQDTLDLVNEEFEQKAEQVAAFIRELSIDSEGYKAEIERLSDRKKAIDNKVDSMKDYLRVNMQAADMTKIKGKLFTITLGAPTETVYVADSGLLPDDLVYIKREPNKTDIKAQLKSGAEIEGCALVQGKARLTIK
jgi:hypothetical protein